MAGVNNGAPAAGTISALRRHHIGNVILIGASGSSVTAAAAANAHISSGLSERGVVPFISTDQEGGFVQRFYGSGFSRIPSALDQGQLSPGVLQARATRWGKQLAAAGISLNLAPVADTVPAAHAKDNQPIGRYDREYGHTPSVVATHVAAVVQGETAGGVDVTVKHFPGLGRATGNTDDAANVTDPTTRLGPYIRPYQAGVDAGAQFVMVSLATYPHIDPKHQACFSATILTDMLRVDLGFTGVAISDDFHAVAVRSVPPARAAIEYFRAGGTMLLDTDRRPIYAMEEAVLNRTKTDSRFAATIKAAVLRVLQAKSDAGLLS